MKIVTKLIFLSLILFYLLILLLSRNPLIVDDVHPQNTCSTLLEKADILYVILFQENSSIVDNPTWCTQIKSLNKTLGLHGIKHTYHEFGKPVSSEELTQATSAFEKCFDEKPTLFRPPYNLISQENREKVESLNMTVYNKRFFEHPYCHCNPHSFMKILNVILFC